MEKIKINRGHTNREKYKIGDTFVLFKDKNPFNHLIDYSVLSEFDFVPKLIEQTEEKLVWDWIEGEHLTHPTKEDLVELGRILRTLHKSEIKLHKNNLRKRIQSYLKIVHEKGHRIPEIEDNYREMFKLMSRMGNLNPTHNDVWPENIIKDQNGKIWLVDWEYATMGDKHFDIAYLIESMYLDEHEEKIFLDSYNSFDDYNAYIQEWMPLYQRFVNWITIVWAYAQDTMPFDIEPLKKSLNNKN